MLEGWAAWETVAWEMAAGSVMVVVKEALVWAVVLGAVAARKRCCCR